MVDDRKSSTMNSIFLGSTLEKPNVELIINAVATILHSQMLEVIHQNQFSEVTSFYVGLELRQDYTVGQRPVFLFRGEIYTRKARGFR